MKEAKVGVPPSEKKLKPKLQQIVGRVASAVMLMSTLGLPGDVPVNQVSNSSSTNYSHTESSSLQGIEREIKPAEYCLFISGGMGTTAGLQGIREGLVAQYGEKNVKVFNSVLNFEDSQNPKRFEQMADFIVAHSRDGLDIVAHSLGSVELEKAIKIIQKKYPSFFDKKENTEKLNILLIAPTGFNKNIKDGFITLGKYWRFMHEVASLPVISKKDSFFKGIDALAAFPPKGVASDRLAIALRSALPELSQLKDNPEIGTFPLEDEGNYFDKLSPEEKTDYETYSDMIRLAIDNENYSGLRSLVAKYGEKLGKPLADVYAGKYETMKSIEEATKSTIGGYIGLLSVLIDGFGGEPMKQISKLQDKGVSVNFIVPEYDFMMPLDEAISFFDSPEEANNHIKVAEGVAHSFPALRKYKFGEEVKNFRGDKAP